MSETRVRATDPRLLLEAARVFNAAGTDYKTIAGVVAESALQARDKADPTVRDAIIGDAVALRLSGRVPGGYRAALELLNEMGLDADGRLHLLRALANGQKYRATLLVGRQKEAKELDDLRLQIREDLAFAFERNTGLKVANQHFWRPTVAALAAVGDREDDLWAVYEDDPEFRKLVDLPAGGAADAGSPPTRDQTSENIISRPANAEPAATSHGNETEGTSGSESSTASRSAAASASPGSNERASQVLRDRPPSDRPTAAASGPTILMFDDKPAGLPVVGPYGAKVGTIAYLLIDSPGDQVAYAVISFDGFPGLGEESKAVPGSVLRLNPVLGGYELNAPPDQVRAAPTLPGGRDYPKIDRAWEEQLHLHFGVRPYWLSRQPEEPSDQSPEKPSSPS